MTTIDEESLAYEFLNTINDKSLHSMIQRDVSETMYSIETCFNYEYREFLRNKGIKNYSDATIFNAVDSDTFVSYIHNRLGIQFKEISYLEFIVS